MTTPPDTIELATPVDARVEIRDGQWRFCPLTEAARVWLAQQMVLQLADGAVLLNLHMVGPFVTAALNDGLNVES